jgi:hypothetical protein
MGFMRERRMIFGLNVVKEILVGVWFFVLYVAVSGRRVFLTGVVWY